MMIENELIKNSGRLHTTEMGVNRIKKNLALACDDVVEWCKNQIKIAGADCAEIKTFEEFSKDYWYRDELIKICKAHGLASPSGKTQLNKVIEKYFHGENIFARSFGKIYR